MSANSIPASIFALSRGSARIGATTLVLEALNDWKAGVISQYLLDHLDPDTSQPDVYLDGKPFIVRELADWQRACYISREEAKRALACLESIGVIEPRTSV